MRSGLLLVLWALAALAQEPGLPPAAPAARPPDLVKSSGESGMLEVWSPNPILNRAILDDAEQVRRHLAPVLGFSGTWDNRIIIRAAPRPERPVRASAFLRAHVVHERIEFDVIADPRADDFREDLRRQVVAAFLYEKLLRSNLAWNQLDSLPLLPLWLWEGAYQALSKDSDRIHERVVRKAVIRGRAPSLETVLGWPELSGETLMRAWQQAFCAYLFDSMAAPGDKRAAFQAWLVRPRPGPGPTLDDVDDLMPSEIEWRSQLAKSPERSHNIVLSWEATATGFAALQSVVLIDPETKDEMVSRLDRLGDVRTHPGLATALQHKEAELTNLELRAHSLWRPVIASARLALTALRNPKAKPSYEELMDASRQELRRITAAQEQWNDYLNWYVVNKGSSAQGSAFASYFRLRDDLERLDPRQVDQLRQRALLLERTLRE